MLGLAFLCTPVLGDEFTPGESYTGIEAGFLGSGRVELTGERADQRFSYGAGIFFDFPFGAHMHYGVSADLLQMNWSAKSRSYDFEQREMMLDVGINFKATLTAENSPIALRPGIGVGFGALRRLDGFSGSNYLTLKAFSELVYFTPGDLAFLVDGGVWYAPTGGDNDHDITIGPLMILRFGIMF
jgi:hypothetical protein